MSKPQSFRSWILCIPIFTICSCGNNSEEIARLRERIVADSIWYVRSLDSLAALDFKTRLGSRYQDFGIKAPEKTIDEAYRVHIEFGWGMSPVGAIFSMLAEKSGARHSMQIYSWPDGKRTELTKEISADEFNRISRAFDSIDFVNQPLLLKVDYTRYDASKYVVESFKGGSYHAISRSDSVDLYVYKLLADFAAIAGVSPELVKDFRRKARGEL